VCSIPNVPSAPSISKNKNAQKVPPSYSAWVYNITKNVMFRITLEKGTLSQTVGYTSLTQPARFIAETPSDTQGVFFGAKNSDDAEIFSVPFLKFQANLKLPGIPLNLVNSPDGIFSYILLFNLKNEEGYLLIFNFLYGVKQQLMQLGRYPISGSVTNDSQYLLVADQYENLIEVINLTNLNLAPIGISVCPNPSEVIASPYNSEIGYVLCGGIAGVQIININSRQVLTTISLPEPGSSMTIAQGGEYGFITLPQHNEVAEINFLTGQLQASISATSSPLDSCLMDNFLFVFYSSGLIVQYDPNSLKAVNSLNAMPGKMIATCNDNSVGYLANVPMSFIG
jgi:hypothetical protein